MQKWALEHLPLNLKKITLNQLADHVRVEMKVLKNKFSLYLAVSQLFLPVHIAKIFPTELATLNKNRSVISVN